MDGRKYRPERASELPHLAARRPPPPARPGEHFRVLLITGPNTGGKTVALKTIGLLTLMAQTGLFIPADPGSVVSVFPAVFIDVGDEQSIAQSLSTFSGHIRTVIGMLREVAPGDLVLLDELGAGTDPQEGSALARAIVSRLLELGPLVVATTHYPEVKAFAFATPGVENASVEFDVATLAPTYRLMIGVPGRSNALAIARRLGMPEEILDAAAGLVDPDELRVDSLLQDIRRRRDEADAYLQRARTIKRESEATRDAADRALREAERQRREARDEALIAAEAELAEARETLKRLQRDRETLHVAREHLDERRREVESAANRVRTFRRTQKAATPRRDGARPIGVGDRVRIIALDQEGEVIAVEGGAADVMNGSAVPRRTSPGRGSSCRRRAGRSTSSSTCAATARPRLRRWSTNTSKRRTAPGCRSCGSSTARGPGRCARWCETPSPRTLPWPSRKSRLRSKGATGRRWRCCAAAKPAARSLPGHGELRELGELRVLLGERGAVPAPCNGEADSADR
jgi:dsDNA-specific endonuclease/ATPase MutS2